MLKKLFFLNLIFLSLVFFSSCREREKFYIYSFQEEVANDLARNYSKEKNVDVICKTFDKPSDFINIFKSKKADLICMPNTLINYFKSLDMLLNINYKKLNNKKDDNFIPLLANWIKKQNETLNYDVLEYAAPYYFETFGILYNSTKIAKNEIEGLKFKVMKEKIDPFTVSLLLNEIIDFSIYLLSENRIGSEGLPLNASISDYIKWYNFPKKLFNRHTKFTNISEYEKSDIIMTFSSIALNIIKNKINTFDDTKFKYNVPTKTGSLINFRSFGVLKNSDKKDMAYDFINYARKNESQELLNSKYNYFSVFLNEFRKHAEKAEKYLANPLYNDLNKFLFKEISNIHSEGLTNGKVDNFFSFNNEFVDEIFKKSIENNLNFRR